MQVYAARRGRRGKGEELCGVWVRGCGLVRGRDGGEMQDYDKDETILQSCHIFGSRNCPVSSLHVDLGLPVCLLFGDISLYHIIFSIVWQKLVIPTRFFALNSWNSYFVFPSRRLSCICILVMQGRRPYHNMTYAGHVALNWARITQVGSWALKPGEQVL